MINTSNSIRDLKTLRNAKINKNDQFFTQLFDIENELCNYSKQLKGKTVLVNCDGSIESNFRKHFMMMFDVYGLKKLIVTTFNTDGLPAKKYEITEQPTVNKTMMDSAAFTYLDGDGDFRAPECVDLLKECDVVVGNPPFSLFREYVSLILSHNKQLLIIGNLNAVTYKEIFPLIKDNKLWLGTTLGGGLAPEFQIPPHYEVNGTQSRTDEDGNNFVRVNSTVWFTNLPHDKRKAKLLFVHEYNDEDYPSYDNYDAINVNKVKDIPVDYEGIIGVPITFLNKYNPDQFEIVGLGNGTALFGPTKTYNTVSLVNAKGQSSAGKVLNRVLVLAYDHVTKIPKRTKSYYVSPDYEGVYVAPYARILVRMK